MIDNWPRHPSVYEINTWVWLSELERREGSPVDLGSVPEAEWDRIGTFGFDAVWLMGVWERSPAGVSIANQNERLLADFRRALPDFTPADNVGSPYCVRQYVVDRRLGGAAGLAQARLALAARGIRLILDFVPNHVARDHPWVRDHPEYFVQGTEDDLRKDPGSYVQLGSRVYACGRDPYFPAWTDVLQLNVFHPVVRSAAIATLSDIASQCDGVRCDMGMLLLNAVFARTWGSRAGSKPSGDYWQEVIPAVKQSHPAFLFIAEAYWDLEWDLQQQGFDFCYDKRLYDRLEHGTAESVRQHLIADVDFQSRLVRFIENHDEPRAAAAFAEQHLRAAAVVAATLPGARLFHDGQLEGRTIRVPVFLARRAHEPIDVPLAEFYHALLEAIDCPLFRTGHWRLCDCSGWPDNESYQNMVAWSWELESDRCLIVVNLSDRPAQARVHIDWPGLGGRIWTLSDAISGSTYSRIGSELAAVGLYVDLPAWRFHLLEWRASTSRITPRHGAVSPPIKRAS